MFLINEMLTFSEWLTTERWISISHSSIYCTPLDLDKVAKISFVGFIPRELCLMLSHTTMSLFHVIVFLSLRGVFGGIRLP